MNLGKALIASAGKLEVPTVIGTPFQGGYYSGRLKIAGQSYALIVAPKAGGESTSLALHGTGTEGNVALSTWDGLANTNAYVAQGTAPGANFCKNLTIGGFTDWAVPARDQLELLYRYYKPTTTSNYTSSGANPSSDPVGSDYTSGVPAQTSVLAFRAGGAEVFGHGVNEAYISSTHRNASGGYNYGQEFANGLVNSSVNEGSAKNIRAVRMIAI